MEGFTAENLPYIIAFLVPGIVTLYVRCQFITGRNLSTKEALLPFLVLTIIYYGMVFPFAQHILELKENSWYRAFLWIILVIVGPAIFGAILGISIQLSLFRRLLRKIGIHTIHALPTAWDWKFSWIKGGEWVLITLKNGTEFAGYLGDASFASSDPTERDIYIQQVCEIASDGTWVPQKKGVLISAGEISTIEFIPV